MHGVTYVLVGGIMDKETAIMLIVGVLFLAFFINGGVQWSIQGYDFQQKVGNWFILADSASDAKTKAFYFDKFVDALEKEGLTTGHSAIYWQQPKSDLAENFKVVQSLQTRLHDIVQMDTKSFEYQTALNQITLQEFCWFPYATFEGAYLLRHGVWHMSLTPQTAGNRCSD